MDTVNLGYGMYRLDRSGCICGCCKSEFVGRKIMKIHIIGGPGSGKTFLADRLSRQYGIPHYDLDDLQWDNAANDYGTKRDPQERAALLDQILQRDDWIIEGVYYAW